MIPVAKGAPAALIAATGTRRSSGGQAGSTAGAAGPCISAIPSSASSPRRELSAAASASAWAPAYACKHKADTSIAVAFFGDGALEEGVSFEALNIASLWKLPVLFLCENNSSGSWAPGEGYPTLVHASSDLRSIAQSLGIKTARIDGADVSAVHAAASEAAAQCRRGEGPFFMEAMTRRWPGSNPLWPQAATGVTDIRMATGELGIEGDHRDWLEHHDPVLRLARQLMATGTAAKTRLHALDAATRARIENAVQFARKAPLPRAESALDHVFA